MTFNFYLILHHMAMSKSISYFFNIYIGYIFLNMINNTVINFLVRRFVAFLFVRLNSYAGAEN